MKVIGILDCGISNVGSVQNAFTMLRVESKRIHKPDELESCSHVVLPGDGSFPEGMSRLLETGLDEATVCAAKTGKMILGICLGMQLFAEEGDEFEVTRGLGLVRGRVAAMRPNSALLPLPQVGWNDVTMRAGSRLVKGLGDRAAFYFMQSFAYDDAEAPFVVAQCDYGGPCVAAIEQDNIVGVQFHPEKSQWIGLRLLKNFAEME